MDDRILKAIAGMVASFPNATFSEANVDAYRAHLARFPVDLVEEAIALASERSDFPPSIAAIIALVTDKMLALPGVDEAVEMIEQAVSAKQTRDLHPLVYESLELVGGSYTWRHTENLPTVRAQFRDFYRERVERERRRYVGGELTQEEIESYESQRRMRELRRGGLRALEGGRDADR